MFADLDKTLEALIRRDLPANLSRQVAISFARPDDNFPPQSVSLPAIDLFLYDIRENLDLRSNEWRTEREGTRAKVSRAPIRVDCSYLITAWASESAPNPVEDEHNLLSIVTLILVRYRFIPDELLQGALLTQTPGVVTSILQPGYLQSLGEFWQAMGGKPKLALNYTVTISIVPFAPVEFPVVTGRAYSAEGNSDGEDQ